jgi:hypothetical protein
MTPSDRWQLTAAWSIQVAGQAAGGGNSLDLAMRQDSESFLNFNPACQFIVCQIGDRARDYLATAGRNFRPFSSLHLLAHIFAHGGSESKGGVDRGARSTNNARFLATALTVP